MTDSTQDTSKLSILDLFQLEVKTQATIFNEGLLALKTQSESPQTLNSLILAAHSIKGAAQIAEIDPAVHLAHTLNDCFIATQNQTIALGGNQVDVLHRGVDQLLSISQVQEKDLTLWLSEHDQEISNTIQDIASLTEDAGTQRHADAEIQEHKEVFNNTPPLPLSMVFVCHLETFMCEYPQMIYHVHDDGTK